MVCPWFIDPRGGSMVCLCIYLWHLVSIEVNLIHFIWVNQGFEVLKAGCWQCINILSFKFGTIPRTTFFKSAFVLQGKRTVSQASDGVGFFDEGSMPSCHHCSAHITSSMLSTKSIYGQNWQLLSIFIFSSAGYVIWFIWARSSYCLTCVTLIDPSSWSRWALKRLSMEEYK